MTETTDILIIGGGVMGSSIAYHLAKQAGGVLYFPIPTHLKNSVGISHFLE
jgi:3-hydroxyacyl-CoA dehydrogenase